VKDTMIDLYTLSIHYNCQSNSKILHPSVKVRGKYFDGDVQLINVMTDFPHRSSCL